MACAQLASSGYRVAKSWQYSDSGLAYPPTGPALARITPRSPPAPSQLARSASASEDRPLLPEERARCEGDGSGVRRAVAEKARALGEALERFQK